MTQSDGHLRTCVRICATRARELRARCVYSPRLGRGCRGGLASGRCLTTCAAIRGEVWSPSPGACHDRYDASSVPARCDDTGPVCRGVLPGPVLRAHPRAVRLPTPPLVRLVRDPRPGSADRNPASTHRAVHPIPRRVRADGLLGHHLDARGSRIFPVRPHRRPDRLGPRRLRTPSGCTATSPAPRAWTGSS